MNIVYGIICWYLACAIVTWGIAYVHFSKSSRNRPLFTAIIVGLTWFYGLSRYISYRLKGANRG